MTAVLGIALVGLAVGILWVAGDRGDWKARAVKAEGELAAVVAAQEASSVARDDEVARLHGMIDEYKKRLTAAEDDLAKIDDPAARRALLRNLGRVLSVVSAADQDGHSGSGQAVPRPK